MLKHTSLFRPVAFAPFVLCAHAPFRHATRPSVWLPSAMETAVAAPLAMAPLSIDCALDDIDPDSDYGASPSKSASAAESPSGRHDDDKHEKENEARGS